MDEYKLLNGALMRKYQHTLGRMFIKVQETLPGGHKITGLTTDKQEVTLEMDSPLMQPLQGWIEAIGRSKGDDVFLCREIICFDNDENELPLDEDAHNEICQILDIVRENDLYQFN